MITSQPAASDRPASRGLTPRERLRYAGTLACVPMSRVPPVVKCPQCGKPVAWTAESTWRPFCSERCKMIDLGAWASERYRIRTAEAPESGDPEAGES